MLLLSLLREVRQQVVAKDSDQVYCCETLISKSVNLINNYLKSSLTSTHQKWSGSLSEYCEVTGGQRVTVMRMCLQQPPGANSFHARQPCCFNAIVSGRS